MKAELKNTLDIINLWKKTKLETHLEHIYIKQYRPKYEIHIHLRTYSL